MSPDSARSLESRPTNGADELKDLRELHRDVRLLITGLGKQASDIEKDQAERRSFLWLKPLVERAVLALWFAVLGLDALAFTVVWWVLHHG